MIDLDTLTEHDKGRWVVYTPTLGPVERGRLKTWNHLFVFVVYRCANQWDRYEEYTAAATCPEDLVFSTEAAP